MKNCQTCEKPIVKAWPYLVRKATFCSYVCRRQTEETKIKISAGLIGGTRPRGEENPKWKGGVQHKRRYNRQWQILNAEKVREYSKQYQYRKRCAVGSHTLEEWNAIKGPCVNCGSKERIERDHIVPLSKGGTNYISNIQPLCRGCNAKKYDKFDY